MNLNKILIYLLFICLSFGQLQSFGWFYLHDLLIGLLIILNFRHLSLSRSSLFFILAGFFSLIINPLQLDFSNLLFASLYLFRWLLYAFLPSIFKVSRLNLRLILKIFILVLTVFGLLQYLFFPDTRFLFASGWDDHYFRAISTLFDPNYFGGLLVLGLILFQFRWPSLILLIALFLTYSRSSYLSLLAVIFSYSVLNKKYRYLLISLMFLVLPFLPRPGGDGVKLERLFSINQRLENYRFGWQVWQQYPIFGIGFNSLRYLRQDYSSHAAAGFDSSLLFVLVTTGVVGLVAYLNWLKSFWTQSQALKLTLIALLVHSCFQNTLFYPWHLIWLWSITDS